MIEPNLDHLYIPFYRIVIPELVDGRFYKRFDKLKVTWLMNQFKFIDLYFKEKDAAFASLELVPINTWKSPGSATNLRSEL